MMRFVYVVTVGLMIFGSIKAMELQDSVNNAKSHRVLFALLETTEQALGGVATAVDITQMIAEQDQLIALTNVMSSVMNGLELKDDHLIVPGNLCLIPLDLASNWINDAFHIAEKKQNEGSEFVTSDHETVKACQEMLKKLWHFGLCLDLEDAKQDDLERLYINRMIRIGALINYRDPRKRDMSLLRQYANIQVFLEPKNLSRTNLEYSPVDSNQFETSAIALSACAKKTKKTGCFARCISKK